MTKKSHFTVLSAVSWDKAWLVTFWLPSPHNLFLYVTFLALMASAKTIDTFDLKFILAPLMTSELARPECPARLSSFMDCTN